MSTKGTFNVLVDAAIAKGGQVQTLSTHDPVLKLTLCCFTFFFGAFFFFQTFLTYPTIPYEHSLFGVSKSHSSSTRMRNLCGIPSN